MKRISSAFLNANKLQLFRVSILWNMNTRMQTIVLRLCTFTSGFQASFRSIFAKGLNHSAKRALCFQTHLIGLFFLTHKNKVFKRKIFALKQLLKPTARRQPPFHPTRLHLHHLHLDQQKEPTTRIAFVDAVALNLTALLKSFTTCLQIQPGIPPPRQSRMTFQAPPHHHGSTGTWKKTSASSTTTPAAPSPLINKYKRA